MNEGFEDPKLKSALKRVWSTPTAPPDLRARMQQLMRESGEGMSITPGSASDFRAAKIPGRQRWIGYAIAASILLCAGLATWWPMQNVARPGFDLPQSVANGFVTRHDLCCTAPDHHFLPGVGPNDFPAVGTTLAGTIQVPVISTALKDWTFTGAGPCPVAGNASAHLLYRQGNSTLSVFSIPAKNFSLTDQQGDYAMRIGDHDLAGFVKDGGLYCVVARSPASGAASGNTSAQARAVRDQLESDFNKDTYQAPRNARTPSEPSRHDDRLAVNR